jgi:predicted nucleic acid-binding protein
MIVVDASVMVELLLSAEANPRIVGRLLDPGEAIHAPHLLDVEVAHVLRRCSLSRVIGPRAGEVALADLLDLPVVRHPHALLLPRIWELRKSISAYDAAYVALAEVLEAPLLTRDARLARSHGHRARIELV